MSAVRAITVHHDGMNPFFDVTESSSAGRLEAIRRAHRERRGWGDIGYNYAIDRAGRVFECRSVEYQGAHVRNHNEGNIGVLVMGNFDQQSPTQAQLDALRDHVSQLMRQHGVHSSRIRTHREWETAVTACPGGELQQHMNAMRSRRMFG